MELSPPIVPRLQINIPTINFSQGAEQGGLLTLPFLTEYISGIYAYLIGIGGILAGVMLVVGGIKYLTSAGSAEQVSSAKNTIRNALIGLVLTLGAYTILFTLNPDLIKFQTLKLTRAQPISLEFGEIEEGEGAETVAASGQPGRPLSARGVCTHYVEDIRNRNLRCPFSPLLTSPTGGSFACNYHTANGSKPVEEIRSLDMDGGYGATIYAPVAGRVEIKQKTEAGCRNNMRACLGGNGLRLHFGDSFIFSISHIKEYLVPDGPVAAGTPIAKVGGRCCSTYNTPEWKELTTSGPDRGGGRGRFFWSDTCVFSEPCQPIWEVGNSKGPHMHVTLKQGSATLPILSCLQGVGIQ